MTGSQLRRRWCLACADQQQALSEPVGVLANICLEELDDDVSRLNLLPNGEETVDELRQRSNNAVCRRDWRHVRASGWNRLWSVRMEGMQRLKPENLGKTQARVFG
jgi:hypothetical protein